MLSSSSYDSQVYLYALADPDLFVRQNDAVTKLVFEALQLSPTSRHRVTLSPDSGWLEYTALDELWNRRTTPALPSKADGIKIAETFLTQLERKCSDANAAWPKSLRGMPLLPPIVNLRRVGLFAMTRPDGSAIDHWLYRAEPRLILDGGGKTAAVVFGAQVEVRVGHRGQIIGVRSRWQPLSGERKFTTLSPYQAPADNSDNGVAPIVKYYLEGDGIPQYYLAPYYFTYEDLDANMTSASPYSLTVDVARAVQGKEKTTMAALAQGGSGDYIYNWAYYSMVAIEQGIQEVGSGNTLPFQDENGATTVASSIDLNNGAYVVLLNVKDRKTGAFKHQQQQVFSTPVPGQSDASDATFPNA
jgi:hypothetical protein